LEKTQRNFLTSLINRLYAVHYIAKSYGRQHLNPGNFNYIKDWRFVEINKLTSKGLRKYKCFSIKSICINKTDEFLSSAQLASLHDQTIQVLFKNVLMPVIEARSDFDSYGFRPGRGGKMAVARVASILQSKTSKK